MSEMDGKPPPPSLSTRPSRPYWFYRIYFVGAMTATVAIGMDFTDLNYLLATPFALTAGSLLFSVWAFKWKYSAFGPLPRTPIPDGIPLAKSRLAGGSIGMMSSSFIHWTVYASGLGFRVWGVGSGFIPFEMVHRMKKNLFGGLTLLHHSGEVRSPILISSRKIRRALQEQAQVLDLRFE